MSADRSCELCEHPFDLHALIAAENNPMKGGIVLCPVFGCPCYATFGIQDNAPPAPLPPQEIDRLRTAVQTGEM